MPSFMVISLSRLISRAFRCAMITEPRGCSLVPGFLSEPYGDPQISAGWPLQNVINRDETKILTENFSMLFIEKQILKSLRLLRNCLLHPSDFVRRGNAPRPAIRPSPFHQESFLPPACLTGYCFQATHRLHRYNGSGRYD